MTDSCILTDYCPIIGGYFPPKLAEKQHVKVHRLTKAEVVAVNALSQILSPSELVWNLHSVIGQKFLFSGLLSSYANVFVC